MNQKDALLWAAALGMHVDPSKAAGTHNGTNAPRSLSLIAADIRRDWANVYFGAVPYLDALSSLDKITDNYGADSGDSVVAYFLANAKSWRGPVARHIKAELNAMLESVS